MTSKFELTISTGYVPDWGIVEAMREIFQNALDNEISNPENVMGWSFEDGTIRVSNKTSKLKVESLLLGCSTKTNDKNTIGKWGEGYKIAFMVLLRNNKKIKVYNYGAREVWDVKLVKSKRYNGQLITTVFVDKEPVWRKIPEADLIIEVSGITDDEYKMIQQKNLHLREDSVKNFNYKDIGSILLDESERGNIYVKGLFITNLDKLVYGYDFEPSVIDLDRDRRMINAFDIQWQSSRLWIKAGQTSEELLNKALDLIENNEFDTSYVSNISAFDSRKLADGVAKRFYSKYGDDAVPVTNNHDYDYIKNVEKANPIIVTTKIAEMIERSSIVSEENKIYIESLQERFRKFLEKIEGKLTDKELNEFESLISEVNN